MGGDLTEEDEAEEYKAEEATVEVVKANSAQGGKHVKKNSYAIELEQSKKSATKKNI
jgi:hypothetical protein